MTDLTIKETRALIEAADDVPRITPSTWRTIARNGDSERIVERLALLQRFFTEFDGTPHVWGRADCSLVPADWAVWNGHADPAAQLRGTYATEAECKALLASRGGLTEVFADCAARAGLSPLSEPEFGAVAVVGSPRNPDRQWGAIWNGMRWLVKWNDRFMPFSAHALAIWRV